MGEQFPENSTLVWSIACREYNLSLWGTFNLLHTESWMKAFVNTSVHGVHFLYCIRVAWTLKRIRVRMHVVNTTNAIEIENLLKKWMHIRDRKSLVVSRYIFLQTYILWYRGVICKMYNVICATDCTEVKLNINSQLF